MPQVTVYVREEDLAKWKAIEKKSEWLHKALQQPMGTLYPVGETIVPGGKVIVPSPEPVNPQRVKSVETKATAFVPRPPDPETGYPCCQGTKPCRHWHFNGDTQLWTNEITGKTKEPGA